MSLAISGLVPVQTPGFHPDNLLPDPLADKIDWWGYRKLNADIGINATRRIATQIEFSRYPDLVRAIVTLESNWSANVHSQLGAVGLMQIKPSTARSFDPSLTNADIKNPVTNVQLGIRIFEDAMIRYADHPHSEVWALTAYNTGLTYTDKLAVHSPTNRFARAALKLTTEHTENTEIKK